MPEGGLLVVPADPIVNAYLPEKQKVVRFGPDEGDFITELVERKDSLTFRANFLEEAIDPASNRQIQCDQCHDCSLCCPARRSERSGDS